MTADYHDRNFDAMSGRGLAARWVLTAALRLETAAHFGCQGNSALDMPILRCAKTGQPLLPGTSLGGALRAYLLDRLADEQNDWEGIDRQEVAKVFGGVRADDDGFQSPLIVFDSLGTLPPDSVSTEVRDGVMIETATGTAADHKKFDFEVLPPGTTFDLRLDLLVPARADEAELFSLLVASLEGLSNGDVCIGLRRSRGLGELSCRNWMARRYDLSAQQGWLDWIACDHIQRSGERSGLSVRDAILSAMPTGSVLHDVADNRRRTIIEADAAILGDLLIRSPNADAGGPDVRHLRSGGQPVLSGTSLTGVIRAQAVRIVRLVHDLSSEDAEECWIGRLFGPCKDRAGKATDFQPQASRLRVSERPVTNGVSQRLTRVAIDRFTQGVVPAALFDEQPHVGGTVQLRFVLRNPHDGEVGLLLLVLKDLLTGQLPVGGTSSVGRGLLLGQRLTVRDSHGSEPIEVTFDLVEARSGRVPSSDELNRRVQEFVQAGSANTKLERAAS